MKLATYNDGSRDGQLVVVSRDLSQAHYATHIANTLQQVLDDWNFLSPQLQEVYDLLTMGRARNAFAFDPLRCMAPLPRSGQRLYAECLDAQNPRNLAMRWGPSGDLQSAHAQLDVVPYRSDTPEGSQAIGDVRSSAEIAVICSDIPRGCSAERALDGVRLLLLTNGCSLAHLQDTPPGSQNLPSACSPVATTLDELGEAWSHGRAHLHVQTTLNGRKLSKGDGKAMPLHFGQLIALAARNQALRTGCLISSGPLRNLDAPSGESNTATNQPLVVTPGNSLRIDMQGPDGKSLVGAITQEVTSRDAP